MEISKTGSDIYSSPAIGVDGTIYIGSNDNNVYALDPNGKLKWSYQTGGSVYSSPALSSDGTVYVGSLDGKLYALNPDGTLKWSYLALDKYQILSPIRSAPAIGVDGTIYINSSSFYALNPENGKLKWRYDEGAWTNTSPAIGDDGTIYTGRGSALRALDPNGNYKWDATTEGLRSSPAIRDDGTIYMAGGSDVWAFNPDGSLKWRYPSYVNGTFFSPPAIGTDGAIYMGLCGSVEHGKFCALNPDGTLKWSYQIRNGVYSAPAIGADGKIYVGGGDSTFYAFDPNGNLYWKYYRLHTSASSPAIGPNGKVYIGNHDGEICAFVTTEDNEAPEIICPSDMTISYANILTPVNYEATVTDNVYPNPILDYTPASGTGFPLGATIVTVTATDYAGNSSECNFTVTVEDNTAPELICPQNITVSTMDTLPEINYEATATDNIDPNPILIYEPASGSEFSIGTTEVSITAMDYSGNSSECNFIVTVKEKDIEPDSNQPIEQDQNQPIDAEQNQPVEADQNQLDNPNQQQPTPDSNGSSGGCFLSAIQY